MNDASGSEINDLLGAYALDAVDRDERELVERHLADDPVARAEVDEMRETAAVLASLPVDDEGAPAGLWNRIAGAIGASDESPAALAPGVVVPLTRRTRSVPMRLAASVAAVAALIIAVLAVQVATGSPNRAGNIAAAYDHAVASGATTVQLENPSGNVVAEIALQRDGTGYLRSDDLGPLPNGNTYQLWAITGSGTNARVISAGVLGREIDAVPFHVAAPPDTFAVTVELAPGVVQSKNTPEAVGSLVSRPST